MNTLIVLWGSSGAGFRFFSEHLGSISLVGWILMILAFLCALYLCLTSYRWFPVLSDKLLSADRWRWLRWMNEPRMGYFLPFAGFFLLFPVFGLFSSRPDTWWIFLIFGWIASAGLLDIGRRELK